MDEQNHWSDQNPNQANPEMWNQLRIRKVNVLKNILWMKDWLSSSHIQYFLTTGRRFYYYSHWNLNRLIPIYRASTAPGFTPKSIIRSNDCLFFTLCFCRIQYISLLYEDKGNMPSCAIILFSIFFIDKIRNEESDSLILFVLYFI